MTEPELHKKPRRYPRFVLGAIYALEGAFVHVLRGKAMYARQLRRTLRVRREVLRLPALPRAFDGYTIAHVSDFHAGPFLDAQSVAPVVAKLRELAPDLLCFTGDYLSHVADEGIALAAAFSGLQPRDGAFLVFGNHDYRHRREGEIAAAFAHVGVTALRNQGVAIERDGARIFLAGIEDVEEGKYADLDAALAHRRDGDFTILLAHHPDVALSLRGRGIALHLAGHTHGGQVVLFGRSIFGASLRSRFAVGMHDVAGTHLHVTSGIGVLITPFRCNAPPEIAVLELRRG